MSEAGRPTVLTEELRLKIEDAASLGATIEEIALHSGVHRSTMYRWMKEDEKLKDRIIELQERPILKARKTIVDGLDKPDNAKWYLERKKKVEFSQRTELTGEDGKDLTFNVINYADTGLQVQSKEVPDSTSTSS